MKEIPLIDTNLLLLFVIGSVDHGNYINSSKRLGDFTFDDYKILIEYISSFQNFATTPYILTEVSNLIDLHDYASDQAYDTVQYIAKMAEVIDVIPRNDTQHTHFKKYGITDVNILNIALTRPVVTNDKRLSTFAYTLCPVDNIVPWYIIKARNN
ncbi:hypothetical protein OP862_10105 [Yersinia massiliensis]|uniref:PIN domain-containing protein n=1 Tax=Yersinia massiliensis TaxID=419257 RepID=A0AA91BHA8_9GAMM|nr:hypothetical protein [Yersinia massiliensis]MDA5548339.1 hypothetical protein [Yersinia massiliensis]NIL26091.1 hypothetical protein [Yersinia massiliensis]UZM80934.1 hypothetical protein OP862_10105 [Yersinia massiliensis]